MGWVRSSSRCMSGPWLWRRDLHNCCHVFMVLSTSSACPGCTLDPAAQPCGGERKPRRRDEAGRNARDEHWRRLLLLCRVGWVHHQRGLVCGPWRRRHKLLCIETCRISMALPNNDSPGCTWNTTARLQLNPANHLRAKVEAATGPKQSGGALDSWTIHAQSAWGGPGR